MPKILSSPYRQYLAVSLLLFSLALFYLTHGKTSLLLLVVAILGSIETAWGALRAISEKRIGIETFNIFAVIIAFIARDFPSAALIVLMLSFASLLEWRTSSRAGDAIQALLAMKPRRALRERQGGFLEEIDASTIQKGDTLIVKNGEAIPVDGVVVAGKADVNEALVTGESRFLEKLIGDHVLGGTVCEAGFLKIKAVNVGEDSTLEQMIRLVKQASENKSRSERLADRFAGIFLPIVILMGVITYFLTRDIVMVGALFLVACADDMAVAIPLAVSGALGFAARGGVIIKGGEWLDTLSRVKIVILDKTGTLTYGSIAVKTVSKEDGISDERFWNAAGIAEKFSVHPVGKAIFRESVRRIGELPDPEDYKLIEGKGVRARKSGEDIFVGNMSIIYDHEIPLSTKAVSAFDESRERGETAFFVVAGKKLLGVVSVADTVRREAKESMQKLASLGVKVIMLTGDSEVIAKETALSLGIEHYKASLKPEDKLREIEKLLPEGPICMVGDGINDAPALSLADVGVAMGGGGTVVAVEAADIVILNDNLAKIPEMIELGRRTSRVVKTDMVLWLVSNTVGFILVFTGVAGLAFAAFYNFVTDFIPLGNSAWFFRENKKKNG